MEDRKTHRTIIVLAAGKGTRMKSPLAKVLHPLMGRPMLVHLLSQLQALQADTLMVVAGHQREVVEALLPPFGALSVVQEPQLGTGHALMCCRDGLEKLPPGEVLLLAGDAPLTPPEVLDRFWHEFSERGPWAGVVTMDLDYPFGYGRVIQSSGGAIKRIVEQKDATEGERDIHLVNTGVYFLRTPEVLPLLSELGAENAQGEFYLPDLFGILYDRGHAAVSFEAGDPEEWLGINDQSDLALANRILREGICAEWMDEGVTMVDPDSTWIEPLVEIEAGVVLQPFVRLCGSSRLAAGVEVRSFTTIRDCEVGEGAVIRENCHLEGTRVGPRCIVGPFCRTREGTLLGEGVHLGNFVETKKAALGKGVKANHLSYLGDATVGDGSNIGAGTITCNYDGVAKHPTVLGKSVFIGSDTQLVAPVTVGDGAYVGAGTTVTKDVPPGALAVSRVDQKNIEGWVERKKKKKEAKKTTETQGHRE